MATVVERFLKYVNFDTQSLEGQGTHPSTAKQFELARFLVQELQELGAQEVNLSPECYVTAKLPATPGWEKVPALGLISHMDTSDGAPGANIHPRQVVYSGGVIPLGNSGLTLDPAVFPVLKQLVGRTLIVTDGTTLLGADDKAGVAEIMTAIATIHAQNLPHGPLCIGFTPDEEIGEGSMFFEVPKFGAQYAFTVDGGAVGEIEYQNFNAAGAVIDFAGINVHPGSAKGIMRNALKMAMAFMARLPQEAAPETTEMWDGFFHVLQLNGTVDHAQIELIVRDHDAAKFAAKKALLEQITAELNQQYGAQAVTLQLHDQYRNMAEIIDQHPQLLEVARTAIRQVGLEPVTLPIRGGTDGATLSYRGLPCPNLGTGGYNFHGKQEFAVVEEMEQSVQILLNLVRNFSKLSA